MNVQKGQKISQIVKKGCAVRDEGDVDICKNDSKIRKIDEVTNHDFRNNPVYKGKNNKVQTKVHCCQGDLCNSGNSLKQNLFVVVSIVAFVLLMF